MVATAQHLSDLAAALRERGHAVTVVSSRRAYDHPETRYPAREQWRGVDIIRVFSTHFGKRAKWRRAADFASFLLFCSARLLVLPRHDVVVALTTPPLISFLGAWRARLWGARFVYWVMDFNPDEAIAAGWLRADSLAARFLERLSRFSLRRADAIVALDRFMRDRIVAKQIPPEKVAVIPPWSQDGEVRFDAAGREEFRAAHGLQDKFVIMYSGNHSPVHPLDTLCRRRTSCATTRHRVCFHWRGQRIHESEEMGGGRPPDIVPALSAAGPAVRLPVRRRHACGGHGGQNAGPGASLQLQYLDGGRPGGVHWSPVQPRHGNFRRPAGLSLAVGRIRRGRGFGARHPAARRRPGRPPGWRPGTALAAYSNRALMPKMLAAIEPAGKTGNA